MTTPSGLNYLEVDWCLHLSVFSVGGGGRNQVAQLDGHEEMKEKTLPLQEIEKI